MQSRWSLSGAALVEERGRNAKLIDWLDDITADCPKKQAHNMNDPLRRSIS
jgi:hypothetical protein